ncbi:hypothetical protein [Saccharicrinis fermentans]|uniref:Phosphate-selective porin n=1 Tax=Saccharicrinis fermentans DSM 9555 = JCM 21142 TaxID=869213 RepID=W7YFY7_9BACT|nr:hypothetical protein [Saccharicrinis fermentans]GAF03361.1 hypothetical protein JCM21142_42029 [Saccharicrinis fermentans DSM 9555 = JCM 21142]
MKKLSMALLCLILLPCTLGAQTVLPKDTLHIGGAFRYTYMKNSWDESHKKTGGKTIFDVLILNAKGQVKGIDFAIETRYYAESFGGFMLRNGYVGLPLTNKLKLKLGMPRTPFGILPFTSNSFMFNVQYYLGFEDDADLGFLLEYGQDSWEAQFSFAKNSEDVFSQKNNRYAYDLSGDNQELNQWTGRLVHHLGDNDECEFGLSGQYGGVYNTVTSDLGHKWALALHGIWKKNNWDLKTEILSYEFSAKDSIKRNYIDMGAFAADYQVASKGLSYSVALGYQIKVNHLLLNDIKFYNDFSALEKSSSNFHASYMNVTGCMIHTGPIYMLVDYVFAKNHAWIGNNYNQAFSEGGDQDWNQRFNINMGIYF